MHYIILIKWNDKYVYVQYPQLQQFHFWKEQFAETIPTNH